MSLAFITPLKLNWLIPFDLIAFEFIAYIIIYHRFTKLFLLK